VRPVGVEEVRERDRPRDRRDEVRENRDGVVDPGEHEHHVDGRPRERLGAVAEERDESADGDADDPGGEEAAQEKHRERKPAGLEHVEAERPAAERRQQHEHGQAAHHADDPGPSVRWRMPIGARN